MLYFIISALLFVLSFIAGMLGLGVAFIATPILGLFGFDLKNVIMPWSLWLNGLTAIAGAITFARAGMVDWRTAIPLADHHDHRGAHRRLAACSSSASMSSGGSTSACWSSWPSAWPSRPRWTTARLWRSATRHAVKAGFFAGLIGIFAGFLGVGPGFLMMPTLVMVGYTARIAAATNSVIVTLPSFSAFIAHLGDAQFDWLMLILTSITAVIGAWLGARFMAKRVKSLTLSRIFAGFLALLAMQRALILLGVM